MHKKDVKIAFMGTPEFAVKPLEALMEADFNVIGVITALDKPKGRSFALAASPVKVAAQKRGLAVFQPKNKAELLEIVKKLQPDLIIIAAFGMILPKDVLEIPKYGTLNIHASLLPRWRGASPIQTAILTGDEKTGVTIILVNEKMDEGAILAQQELQFLISNFQFLKLQEELSKLGAELLIETIPKWINGEIEPQPQDDSKATYCKIIKKEDGLIDLDNEPPEIIERKIRAFTPWPSAYIFINGKRLIITQAELKNTSLKIKRVKPEGKNEMDFNDYLRGNPNKNFEKYLSVPIVINPTKVSK